MTKNTLQLSIALTDNVRTRPIIEGRISPQGVHLQPSVMSASEMFLRQLKFAEFDISEMSLSSLFISVSQGDRRWVALPIYTMRRFFHTWSWIRTDRGINSPVDLRGKKVGVPEYQQTAAIWTRGILQHEFGVAPQEITWFMERTPETSHGSATGFKPPPGVTIHAIPAHTNIGEMLVSGELDATLLYLNEKNIVDRSSIDLSSQPNIAPMFADEFAEGQRFFAKNGLYPINHAMVIRRSLLEDHPWLALNIFEAFNAAKAEAARVATGVLDSYIRTGLADVKLLNTLKTDPMPYGIKAARPVLETIADWVHEQGLSAHRVKLEDIFAHSTIEA
jgi:4,5-dihydroxyphthalate decarboxylase